MARRRDYAAEYRARVARAQAAGHAGYRSQRRARSTGAEPGGRRQVHTSPAGRVVTTTAGGRGYGVIEAQLRAAGRGARVKIIAEYVDNAGNRRQATIYGKGGRSARSLLDAMAADDLADIIAGDIDDMYGTGGVAAVPSVQVVIF